ncbi:queuosine precursor transporter [Paenibacillus sp. ACRRX]|uniref:queuosine precursor transporter n=1 Tax=unclassified Paenibacillus TaxID=185978 RepID=UPI001EF4B7C2|nr:MULTISPECIES: queuosine precursor transporter [unclassified Paenibacillus]MCG7408115.1 queuosine precursor transporter [Paenibacillus sp. ACRRX]MDK8181502.1 queuosine precursor transporter [Paenibacillus sp. UMB4589-SE434]
MFNAWWGVLFVLTNFAFFLICYRFFGKYGLYAWIGVMTVVANIQVVKTIEMLGIVMTLGNTANATLFLTTDLLNEKYGAREARRAVWFGFFTLIMTTVIMQMALIFTPQTGDLAQQSLEQIFGLMPRIAAGSLTAYFVSQFLDVKLFSLVKAKYGKKNQLWIRSNLSTGISQLADSFVFCMIAFGGFYSWDIWFQIFITTYAVKLIVSVASTPFLYWARSFRVRQFDNTDETAANQP